MARRMIVPLVEDDLRGLTRAELLDRIETEQAYWHKRQDSGQFNATDHDAYEKFREIMHAALNPAEAISDTRRWLEGEPGTGNYWNEVPR